MLVPIDTGGVAGAELLEPEMEIVRLDQDVPRTLLGPHPVEGGFAASDRPAVDGPPAADIYVSEDRGRTWRRTAQLDRGLIFLNYAEGAAVPSVTAHDSVAYVTTLSGVFTKPLADSWTERHEKTVDRGGYARRFREREPVPGVHFVA